MKYLIRLAALLGLLILTGCLEKKQDCDEILNLSFDRSLFDSSTNHFSVNATDTIVFANDRFANNTGAAYLDGSSTISVPNSPKLDFQSNSEYSISVWVRTRSTADACIIAKGEDLPVPGYSLQLRNGKPIAIFTGNTVPIEVASATAISDNIWHLLTLSVTPDSINLYSDTTLVATSSGAQLAPQKNKKGPLYIGKLPNGTKPYKGYLDGLILQPCPQSLGKVTSNYQTKSLKGITMNDMPPGVTDYKGLLDVAWVVDTGYACGTNGLLYKTTDGGQVWAKFSNIVGHLIAVSCLDSKHVVALTSTNQFYQTNDGGGIWTLMTPNFGSATNLNIRGINYAEPTAVLLNGWATWAAGGSGFIVRTGPSGGAIRFLESGIIGEQRMLAVIKNSSLTRLIGFGSNSEVRKYNFNVPLATVGSPNPPSGSPIGIDISSSLPGNLTFQSADIVEDVSGNFTGLVGTQNGKIWTYTESPVGATPSLTSEQVVVDNTLWIVGVRANDGGSSVAITSGLDVAGNPVSSSLRRLNGVWTNSPPLPGQVVVVSSHRSGTFFIPNGAYGTTNDGLSGASVP